MTYLDAARIYFPAQRNWSKPEKSRVSSQGKFLAIGLLFSESAEEGKAVIYANVRHPWADILAADKADPQLAQRKITFLLDDALHEGAFKAVDSALDTLDVDKSSPYLLVSVLSSTIPARKRLHNRASFFARVERSLEKRNLLEPGVLDGLE